MATFHKNHEAKIDLVAAALERAKTVGARGASFTASVLGDMAVILETSLKFARGIPQTERQRIIHQATFAAGASGAVTRSSLLEQVGEQEREYLRAPTEQFVVATTLSLVYGPHLR